MYLISRSKLKPLKMPPFLEAFVHKFYVLWTIFLPGCLNSTTALILGRSPVNENHLKDSGSRIYHLLQSLNLSSLPTLCTQRFLQSPFTIHYSIISFIFVGTVCSLWGRDFIFVYKTSISDGKRPLRKPRPRWG